MKQHTHTQKKIIIIDTKLESTLNKHRNLPRNTQARLIIYVPFTFYHYHHTIYIISLASYQLHYTIIIIPFTLYHYHHTIYIISLSSYQYHYASYHHAIYPHAIHICSFREIFTDLNLFK